MITYETLKTYKDKCEAAKKELEEMLKDENIEETFSKMKIEKDLDDELEALKKKWGG